MKGSSELLFPREIQIETPMRNHPTSSKMNVIKIKKLTRVGKAVEKLDALLIRL